MNNSRGEFAGDLCLPDLPELVIDKIFKYLDWKSLLNCRFVWKGWEKRVKSLIEKNDTLYLNFTENFCPRNDEIIENIFHNPNILLPAGLILSAVNINTISQLGRVSEFHKFRNLHWNFWPVSGNHRGINSIIFPDDFFSVLRILGPNLETFDCFEIFILGMAPDQYNKISGTLSLPNLRKLYLPRRTITEYGAFAHCWQRLIISAAPNLSFVKERSTFPLPSNLDIVKMLNETRRLSKIKGMVLVNLTEEQLDILLQSGIELEEFKARFKGQNSFTLKLQEFLHRQKGTLRKLYLDFEITARPHNIPIVFPIMKNLKHLSFGPGNLFKRLKFAQDIPKLKELELLQSELPSSFIGLLLQDSAFNSDNPCKTLRTLKLDMARNPTAFGKWCDLFGKTFPCVSSLHLRWPTEAFLKGVWTHCPNLKELYLESVTDGHGVRKACLLDDVLFRIPEDWENSVNTSQVDWWTRVTPPESEGPTMLNLKCLEKLTIRDSGSKMTNFSVYFGFAKMKILRLLEITESEKFRISEADLNFLRETIPGLIVTQNDLPTLI